MIICWLNMYVCTIVMWDCVCECACVCVWAGACNRKKNLGKPVEIFSRVHLKIFHVNCLLCLSIYLLFHFYPYLYNYASLQSKIYQYSHPFLFIYMSVCLYTYVTIYIYICINNIQRNTVYKNKCFNSSWLSLDYIYTYTYICI